MRVAIAGFADTRRAVLNPYFSSLLARAYLAAGEPKQGHETVTTALAEAKRTGARYMDSELHRLRGELLLASNADAGDIESAFRLAEEIARRQKAKALERRAAGGLARMA